MGVASQVEEKNNNYGKGVSPCCFELCGMGGGGMTQKVALFQCDNTRVVAAVKKGLSLKASGYASAAFIVFFCCLL